MQQTANLAGYGFRPNSGGNDLEGPVQADRAGQHPVPGLPCYRGGLPGEETLVHIPLARRHQAIYGEALAGAHPHPGSRRDLIRRHTSLPPGSDPCRLLRDSLPESFHRFVAGLVCLHLQPVSNRHQEEQHGCGVEVDPIQPQKQIAYRQAEGGEGPQGDEGVHIGPTAQKAGQSCTQDGQPQKQHHG